MTPPPPLSTEIPTKRNRNGVSGSLWDPFHIWMVKKALYYICRRCIKKHAAADQKGEKESKKFWFDIYLNAMLFIVQFVRVFFICLQDLGLSLSTWNKKSQKRDKNEYLILPIMSWWRPVHGVFCVCVCVSNSYRFLSLFYFGVSGMKSAIVIWLVIIKHEKHGRKIGIVINRVWRALSLQPYLHIPFSVNVRNSIRMAEQNPAQHRENKREL